jgi:NADPH:quinone reductase
VTNHSPGGIRCQLYQNNDETPVTPNRRTFFALGAPHFLALSAFGLLMSLPGVRAAGASRPDPVPKQMRAAAIDRAGEADVLTLHTLPIPSPADGEILMKIDTAGVAVWDVSIRRHPDGIRNSRLPLVLGTDAAGVVAAIGSNVHGVAVGDRVYSYSWDNPRGGFYAEYTAVPAERVGRVPKGLTLREAGAIGTTGLTAIQGIDDALHIHAGETLIIHGAAGGVGTLAVQFAKWRGARILATISADDEAVTVQHLGADVIVNGRKDDIAAAARAFAPAGVDAVLALAGGDALERSLDALRSGGRAAYPNGVAPPKPRRGLSISHYDAIAGPKEFERLNAAIEGSHLQVPIAAVFPLDAAAQAQQRVEAGHVLGKVVLQVSPAPL